MIVAVYDSDLLFNRLRVPKADALDVDQTTEATETSLGAFVRRSGITGSRSNPLVELGALYYFPNRFNADENRTGSVIQKVCETVDGHDVDQALIIDEPAGIRADRRTLSLDGSVDASLIEALSGISAQAEVTYLFELEILNARLRSINTDDGITVRERLLAGGRCRNDFIPQIGDNNAYQLTSAYYGEMRVKQAYEIRGSIGVPRLEAELGIQSENERETFLFFKVFLDEI